MKSYSLVPLFGAFAAAASSAAPAMSVMSMAVMPAPSSAVTAPGGGAIHEILVTQTSFTPNNVAAKQGDVVRFMFMATNQSIAQSTFDAPCTVMSKGVTSGPKPNEKQTVPPPTFDFPVKSTASVFMFAESDNACQTGAVFAVNPATDTGKSTDQTTANLVFKAIGGNKQLAAAMGIVAAGAVSQSAAASPTVTFSGVGAAAATAGSASSPATTVAGQGMTGQGQACGCTCLCGVSNVAAGAGVGAFGGFLGEMAQSPAQQGAMGVAAPSGSAPAAAAMAAPAKREVQMPPMRRYKA